MFLHFRQAKSAALAPWSLPYFIYRTWSWLSGQSCGFSSPLTRRFSAPDFLLPTSRTSGKKKVSYNTDFSSSPFQMISNRLQMKLLFWLQIDYKSLPDFFPLGVCFLFYFFTSILWGNIYWQYHLSQSYTETSVHWWYINDPSKWYYWTFCFRLTTMKSRMLLYVFVALMIAVSL